MTFFLVSKIQNGLINRNCCSTLSQDENYLSINTELKLWFSSTWTKRALPPISCDLTLGCDARVLACVQSSPIPVRNGRSSRCRLDVDSVTISHRESVRYWLTVNAQGRSSLLTFSHLEQAASYRSANNHGAKKTLRVKAAICTTYVSSYYLVIQHLS